MTFPRFKATEVPTDKESLPLYLEAEFVAIEALFTEIINGQREILHVEPARPTEAMVVYADGTNWNPGHGAGLYEYNSIGWTPLFPLTQGTVTTRVHVGNTTTETEIYTTTISANHLSLNEVFRLNLSGYYDTGAASDTWTLRIKLGGTLLHSISRVSANNATDFGWNLTVTGSMRTVGVTGTLIDSAILLDEDASIVSADSTVHTIDTTVANILTVTIQWGAAKVANDFHLDLGFLEVLH